MNPHDRTRFRRNPPNVSVPQGFVDLYVDEEGVLTQESPGGVKSPVGGSDLTSGPVRSSAGASTIADGAITNAKLATNPLARANHTGTQAHTTITGLGTAATASASAFALRSAEFYPEDYGAVGNGTTNDDAAVQAAINAAEANGGGKVILSKLYGLSAGVAVTSPNITIAGHSASGSVGALTYIGFRPLTSSTVCLTIKRKPAAPDLIRGFTARDFSIIGSAPTGTTQVGIDFDYTDGLTSDCAIIDHVNLQFLNFGIKSDVDDSLNITNSRICDNSTGIWSKGAVNAMFSNNIIYDNVVVGCIIQSGYGVVFDGNTCGRDNITLQLQSNTSVVVSGNSFNNDDNYSSFSRTKAIEVFSVLSGLNPATDYGRVIITGNVFKQTCAAASTKKYSSSFITASYMDSLVISNNTFHSLFYDKPDILTYGTSNLALINNVFSPESNQPLRADNDVSGLRLSGNQFNGALTLPATAYRMHTPAQMYIPTFADEAACTAALASSSTTNTSKTVTVSSTAALLSGMTVSGTGIPAGATINTIISTTQVILTKAATATAAGSVTLTFSLPTGTPYKTATGEMRIKL